jgi:hypothetical protein
MGRRDQAADCYARYLKSGGEGDYARYARQRLREWGYVKA